MKWKQHIAALVLSVLVLASSGSTAGGGIELLGMFAGAYAVVYLIAGAALDSNAPDEPADSA